MGQVYVGTHENLMKMKKEFERGMEKEKKSISKEISEIYAKEFYKDASKACAEIIDQWYASYSPKFYDRLYSLKNSVEVELNDTTVDIFGNIDALSGHHLNNEGIYELTMERGLHGGSIYRGPLDYWTHPTRPAVETFSPVSAINKWMDNYEFDSNVTKKIMSIIRKHYSKYEYFRLFY